MAPDEQVQTSRIIEGIRRVELRVQDVDRAVGFYRDVVGLEVANHEGARASLRAPGGSELVRLDATATDAPADRGATGLFHTAFLYPDRASLGTALARLMDSGYEIGAGDHGVSEALYVDDPDENGVELYWDRPRHVWPKPTSGGRVGMYTAPVDLEDLLEEGRASSGAHQGAAAVGHVHLQVRNIREAIHFYADLVGLDVMATMGASAAFMSSNGYHHHVGANTWNSSGASPAPRSRAGLDRVVFAVHDEHEVQKAGERLAGEGHDPRSDAGELIVHDPNGIELRFEPPG